LFWCHDNPRYGVALDELVDDDDALVDEDDEDDEPVSSFQ